MDLHENNLLTSSDYEHLISDLKSDHQFQSFKLSPLHVPEHLPGDQGNGETMKTLQAHVNLSPPPLLQNYGGVPEMQITRNMEAPSTKYSPTCTIPCRDEYPGPLNFEIYMDSTTASKRSWIYSHKLQKVFIDMGKSLLVQFRIAENIGGLHVRALPVYTMDDYVSIPVQRCVLHELGEDSQHQAHSEDQRTCFCANYNWVRHVVQSSNSHAQYDYDPDSDRHSVVVPLDSPQAGSDRVVIEYHFTCKTSCPRGMNRKPIEVIFTLETSQCEVIGRHCLAVKICSCPKRDKDKEEADAESNNLAASKNGLPGKRRISTSENNNGTKKVKIENNAPQNNEPSENLPAVAVNNPSAWEIFSAQISSQATQISELRRELQENTRKLDAILYLLKQECMNL